MSSADIMVSICCITYNHERYIKKTIEGFLMQRTNFAYEIVIYDDASTDNTARIIREYESRYPTVFNVLYQTENQRSKYMGGINPRFNYPRARGKYIAFCEGDDYWTDPYKLQKQVDFLEKNSTYVACYHGCKHVDENDCIIKESRYKYYKDIPADKLLTGEMAMISCTLMFRNIIKYPDFMINLPNGDTILYHLLGFYGDAKFIEDIGYSAYRVHNQGVWSGITDFERLKRSMYTFAAMKKNLIIHYGKDSPLIARLHKSFYSNIRGYLYKALKKCDFKNYLRMIKQIGSQKELSRTFLYKNHFIDIFKLIIKK